jgi:hypothetical protein
MPHKSLIAKDGLVIKIRKKWTEAPSKALYPSSNPWHPVEKAYFALPDLLLLIRRVSSKMTDLLALLLFKFFCFSDYPDIGKLHQSLLNFYSVRQRHFLRAASTMYGKMKEPP